MGNRIIKESIKRSPEIDSLSWFEEVVFYRLIVSADDFGRLDGRPVILKNDLFPTKETVTRKAVEDALEKLTSVGLLVPYVDAESGMPYYYFPSWPKHQRLRKSKERYPAPPQLAANCGELPQVAANCRLESESEYESEYESECGSGTRARAREGSPTAAADPLITYAVNNLGIMSPRAMEELNSFRDELPDDVIRAGIDAALDANVRTWAYARSILNRYADAGYKTVGEIKAAESKRKAAKANGVSDGNGGKVQNPTLDYQQREYKDADFDESFFDNYQDGFGEDG